MIDLETMGTAPDTVVLSLGAVNFNKEGIISKAIFEFDLEEQRALGRSETPETTAWWEKQSAEARKIFLPNDRKIKVASFFNGFEMFMEDGLDQVKETVKDFKPMGNGSNFDITITEDLYRRHHPGSYNAIPWKFWNVLCFRTIAQFTNCKNLVGKKETGGVRHNALDDALFQTECLLAYWNRKRK